MPIVNTRAVRNLLEKWLDDAPATTHEQYLRSAFYDLRRRKNPQTAQVDDVIIEERPPETIPWLPEEIVLPPCEGAALAAVFSDHRFTVVPCGTGSGKTSIVYFIARVIRDLFKAKRLKRNNVLLLDLQSLDPTEYWDRQRMREDRLDTKRSFLMAVVHHFDAALLTRLGNDVLLSSFFALFPHDENPSSSPHLRCGSITKLQVHLKSLLRGAPRVTEWSVLKELIPVAPKTVEEEAKGLQPHEHLHFRFLVLLEAAARLKDEDGLPTALIVDNFDNFPDYLQRALLNTLKVITADRFFSSEGSELSPLPVSVTLFVRLSTTEKHVAAFGLHARYEAIPTPDPADVVFLKLTKRLHGVEEDPHVKLLDAHDQRELLSRAWYFWRSLATSSPVRSILSARAGTNNRNALLYARQWLLSPRITRCPAIAEDFHQQIENVLVGAVALSRFQAALQATTAGFGTASANRRISRRHLWKLFAYFFNCLRTAGRFRKADDGLLTFAEDKDYRQKLATIYEAAFERLASDDVFKRVRQACRDMLLRTVASRAEAAIDGKHIEESYSKALAAHQASYPSASDGAYFALLKRLQYRLRGASNILQTSGSSALEGALANLFTSVEDDLVLKEQLPSRWLSQSVLIAPGAALAPQQESSINILSASGAGLVEIPLIILAILAERQGQAYTGLLRRELYSRGFSDDAQIIEALQVMVQLDHRLIYLGVRDDRDGVASIWRGSDDHKVSLSAAGSRYMSTLTHFPAYIQWCCFSIQDYQERFNIDDEWHRKALASQRLSKLRLMFAEAVKAEQERTKSFGEKWKKLAVQDGLRQSLLPVTWIYFNSLVSFVEDVLATRDAKEIRGRDANSWIQLCQASLGFYSSQFRRNAPKQWEESLGYAEIALDRFNS